MHDQTKNDSAFPLMTMSILENVLSHVDNPGGLGVYLTEELRALSGSRCTILVQCNHETRDCRHRIVCINPDQYSFLAQSPKMRRLIEVVHNFKEAHLWHVEEFIDDASALNHLNFALSLSIPLDVGKTRMGFIFVLGLPELRDVANVLNFMKTLSTIVALEMRNSFLYKQQDLLIAMCIRQLQEDQALFQAIIEGTSDAVFVKDPDGRYLLINQTAARLVGKTAETIIGNDDSFLFPSDIAAKLLSIDKQILAEGKTITLEERVCIEGKEVVFLSTKGPLFGVEGDLIGLLGISRDITLRDKSEQALRDNEELFLILSDSVSIGIFKTDIRGNISYTNPSWEEITGISAKETTVQGWIRSVYPDDRAEAYKLWHEAKVTGSNYSYECRLQTPHKEIVWVRILASPLYGVDGAVTGYVGTVEDITEMQRAKQDTGDDCR